ncbi:hypothetical protein Tco_1269655, partial [Tanacetum coccineum]
SNVTYAVSSMEQGGGTVEQHSATVEETRAYHESLFHNLDAKVEKVNSVNRKMKETNAELTTELARYKNQCLTKKINTLHLSSGKQITALNEEISNLNKQLLKEKATVSSLQEEKKRLKSDFKIREDKFLDKHVQLENKINELDNILVKTGKHDPPDVYDSEETLKLAQKSRLKMKQLNKEIKPKALELEIERLLRAVVSQDIMSIVQCNSAIDTSKLQIELERKPLSSSRLKLYAVTPFLKSKGLPKIDERHALSKPVTLNSVPIPQESKLVKNDNVIAPGMFRINPLSLLGKKNLCLTKLEQALR